MGLNVSWPCSLDYVRARTLGVQGVKYHDGGLWNASDVQGVPQKLSADQAQGLRGIDEVSSRFPRYMSEGTASTMLNPSRGGGDSG